MTISRSVFSAEATRAFRGLTLAVFELETDTSMFQKGTKLHVSASSSGLKDDGAQVVRERVVCSSFDHPPTSGTGRSSVWETQPEPQEKIQDPEAPEEMSSPVFHHQVTSRDLSADKSYGKEFLEFLLCHDYSTVP